MTPAITPEMRQALADHPGQPLYVVDSAGPKNYVLLPASTFERVQPLIYDATDPDVNEFLPLVHEALGRLGRARNGIV